MLVCLECSIVVVSVSNRLLADGIVHVTAKDKATNKDQSMTIASSSGLSDKDIERMVSEAEEYAETDKARKGLIEEANKKWQERNERARGQGEPDLAPMLPLIRLKVCCLSFVSCLTLTLL